LLSSGPAFYLPTLCRPARFSPHWSIEDNGACFIVKDSNGTLACGWNNGPDE
jgi:hypothetical protein